MANKKFAAERAKKPAKAARKPAPKPKAKKTKTKVYDCNKCPSACCSFPIKGISTDEIKVLAKAVNMPVKAFKANHVDRISTKDLGDDGHKWTLRNREHPIFTSGICTLQADGVGCLVYENRPQVCRGFPDGKSRCGFFDFLTAMRKHQADEDYLPSAFSY